MPRIICCFITSLLASFAERREDITVTLRICLRLIIRVAIYFIFAQQCFLFDPLEVIRNTINLERRNVPAVNILWQPALNHLLL